MTRTTHLRVLATTLAGVLLVAAGCGGDDAPDTDDGLRPPVAVEIAVGGAHPTASPTLSPAELVDDARAAGETVGETVGGTGADELSILPWPAGFEYEVADGFPALPDHAVGYEFPVGGDVDEATFATLAAALGVQGEPQRGSGRTGDGILWRVGPDDGTAPALVVIDDAQLGWYLTGAWAHGELVEPVEGLVEDQREGQPSGVPSAADAVAAAGALLDGLGEEPDAFELETWADEWAASVTAWAVRDGVRWPLGFGFGFGENGALQWANGWLADPLPAGPYPLIGLDDALARLAEQQRGWAGVQVEPGAESSDEPGEPQPEVAVLVDVRADLWWGHQADGTIWLLPAYTFVDTEGRTHTVPAVADEFLVVDEPLPIDAGVPIEPETPVDAEVPDAPDAPDAPELLDPVQLDALDRDALVGATVDEATARLEVEGLTLRVARLDGEDLMLTMDYVPTRVNVAVEADVVVELLSVG